MLFETTRPLHGFNDKLDKRLININAVHYLHCARRGWQPGCWQEAAMQTLHLRQLLTAYLPRHILQTHDNT